MLQANVALSDVEVGGEPAPSPGTPLRAAPLGPGRSLQALPHALRAVPIRVGAAGSRAQLVLVLSPVARPGRTCRSTARS